MGKSVIYLIVITCFVVVTLSKDVPSYMKVCHLSDPNLVPCVLESSKLVIANFVKGDKEYGIPPMNPYKISKVNFQAAPNLKIDLENLELYGLETAVLVDTNITKHSSALKINFDMLNLKGNYVIDGQIMVLPIKGSGTMSVKLDKPTVLLVNTLGVYEKDGEVYSRLDNTKVDISAKKITYQFDNLFNGDKALGDQTNKFLNDNWQEVSKELSPAFNRVVEEIIVTLYNAFAAMIPYEKLLPE